TPATTSQRSTISRLREPDDRKSVLPGNGRARQAHDQVCACVPADQAGGGCRPRPGIDVAHYFHYIGNMETTQALTALVGLAHDTRLNIFRLLGEAGPEGLAAGEIVERLRLPNATASFHLKELTHAGLVTQRQAGRFVYYSANYTTMNGLIAYLTENCCRGQNCDIACAPAGRGQRR